MNLKLSIYKLVLLYTFVGITSLYSQQKALYFNLYTIEDGLSQNSINAIVQDQHGFIWLATESGLNRFDGYKFKRWFQEPENANSIASGFLNDLVIDQNNRLWIATTAGISNYNSKSNKFYNLKHINEDKGSLSDNVANCIFVDFENYLWVGTKNGLNRSSRTLNKINLDDSALTFSKYFHKNTRNNLSNSEINCICEDKEHSVWIGTKNGLNRYSKVFDNFKVFFFSQYSSGQNGANEINAVIQINDSNLWVATNAGLFELNTSSGCSFSFNQHKFFLKNKIAGCIKSLLQDSQGNIWLGTSGNGLIYYDTSEKKFHQYKKELENKNRPADNFILSLFEDKSGTLFMGIYGKGLSTTKISGNNFELFRHKEKNKNSLAENIIRHIYYQDTNTVWIGTLSKGLDRFNPITKKFNHYPFDKLNKNKTSVSFQFILPKNDHELWIGTNNAGLLLYNHLTGTYKQYLHNKNKNSISDNNVFWLNNEQDSVLWIGTFGSGLDMLNLNTGKFKHYEVDPGNPDKISHGILLFLKFDKNGQLWIGSWGGGLMKLNPKDGSIKHFNHSIENKNSISSDFITTIHFDKKGILWIGTSSGLNKYDSKLDKFICFGKENGLKDEFINSIEEDEHNNLWISTNMGILRFNKKTHAVVNFDIKDGLQDNEFGTGRNIKLQDGRMIFGGINGFNLFHPDSIKSCTFKPNIVITEFQLFYKKVEIGVQYENGFQLEKSIMDVDTIVLNYKNNVIGFEFTALDYTKPENIKYAFRLKGFEENWNHTDENERFARYTNLTYGNYILQIKSTNGDGVWNPDIKELVIIIQAPIWQTNEFRIVVFIVLILLFILFFKFRTRILIKQKKILEEQVRKRTAVIERKNIELKDKYEEIVVQEEELREQAEELRLISEQLEKANKSLTQQVKARTSELEKALIKAEDAQKLISSFLSNLSHEIRTPMNAIMGFSQLIGSMELSEPKRVYYTGIIEQNVQTLLTQIDNIMDVAKLHTDQYQFKNSVFYLNDIFAQVYDKFAANIKITNKDVSFEFLNTNKLKLNSDPSVFNSIVYNLIENAVKYTEKGFVEFGFKISELSYDEDKIFQISANSLIELEIFVHDSGIGIAEKEQRIIFDAFRKIEDNKQKLYRGTGLGLALVKNLTNKLNGTIIVDSRINEGTNILIKIPIFQI